MHPSTLNPTPNNSFFFSVFGSFIGQSICLHQSEHVTAHSGQSAIRFQAIQVGLLPSHERGDFRFVVLKKRKKKIGTKGQRWVRIFLRFSRPKSKGGSMMSTSTCLFLHKNLNYKYWHYSLPKACEPSSYMGLLLKGTRKIFHWWVHLAPSLLGGFWVHEFQIMLEFWCSCLKVALSRKLLL